MAMPVQQSSVASSLAFASHQPYLAGMGHRTAALEDSRLLPLSEIALTGDQAPNGRKKKTGLRLRTA
jgi:hypothetical protein